MVYEEKTMKSEKIYDGKILNLKVVTVEIPGKKYSKREIIEHPDGVGIIPITDEGQIVLVKQYRKAVGKVLIELPAGKMDVNEEPVETAKRELHEETGYTANEFKYLFEFYTSPGFCNEKIYLFLAKGLQEGEVSFDGDEYCETVKFSIEELDKMIDRGEIMDSKTIIGIYYAKQYIK